MAGMLPQAGAHGVIGFGLARALITGLLGTFLRGLGTALVYPAIVAAVSDEEHPSWRATSLGTCRFRRDSGYAVGALMAAP